MIQRKREGLVFGYCLLAAAACLLICSKSSPLYPINDWTDANAYFSCGKGMVAGRVMYRDLYEHKGPLLYALHALCSLVDPTSFLGVYLLEALAGGLFLWATDRLLRLYGARRTALLPLPVIAALIYSSFSFQQGDSAEELCLPMLAWSLYGILAWLRQGAPRRMDRRTLIVNGVLAGCVLWIKFTMLGFYIPWMLGMMFFHLRRRDARAAWSSLGWFLVGVGLSTAPWLLYFGLNGAIGAWLKTYLYDNLFLYQDEAAVSLLGKLKAILRAGWDWLTLNGAYTVPLGLGLLWFTLRGNQQTASSARVDLNAPIDRQGAIKTLRLSEMKPSDPQSIPFFTDRTEKLLVWAMLGMAALGVFIGGKSYVYYGLILAAFVPLAALPLCAVLERIVWKRLRYALALSGCLAGAVLLCLAASRNTQDLLKPRADTMQYQFAAIVAQTPHATLLNYGFMDAGFYTACSIAPSVKYFHQTNVHLQEMYDEQARYLEEGATEYVVTRGRQPDTISERYELIATAKAPEDFWYDTVYLYRRKD